MALGGDGKEFIDIYLEQPLGPFSPHKVANYSVVLARQYHQVLYKKAESKQAKTGQEIFGGHQHQIILMKGSWEWTKPPK
jgi:hypothetical protein